MYPVESLQGIIEPEHFWFEDYEGDEYKRGRLVWAFIPHVDQNPFTLVPVERGEDPTEHKIIRVKIEPLDIKAVIRYPQLPIAALPQREKEIRTVYLAKKRPALIIIRGGPSVPASLTQNKPKRHTNPTVLIAPYYSVTEGGPRSGYTPEFVERVRLCEYPQFIWNSLPISGNTDGSILRLDQIQPVGKSQNSIEFTNYCLSEYALSILDEWLEWLITNDLNKDAMPNLCDIRDVLLDLD